MNVLLGIGIVCLVLGLVLMFFSMFTDIDWLFAVSIVIAMGPMLVLLAWMGITIVFDPDAFSGPPLQVGSCYRAYEENSYVLVGKVIVPVRGVDLVEISCR